MSKVLILSFSDLVYDSRVRRHMILLKDRYRVIACGFRNPNIPEVDFIPLNYRGPKSSFKKVLLSILLKIKHYETVYWSEFLVKETLKVLSNLAFDLVIANELETLPVALFLANRCKAKVIFDAHEYAPKEYDYQWTFRFFLQDYYYYLCARYLAKADAMLTVSSGIADEYTRTFGIPCKVLTNAPFYEKQEPSLTEEKQIRIVYHGGADQSRRIENLIHMFNHLEKRFTLDLILMGNRSYLEKLQRLAMSDSRIRFAPHVSPSELPKILREYDVGIHLLPPNSFNARLALPNKIFEFIQGRLCVAIWPSAEMAKLVRQFNCGVVSKDFTITSMAEELNRLQASDIQFFKEQAHRAAAELCAEKNQHILLDLVRSLIG